MRTGLLASVLTLCCLFSGPVDGSCIPQWECYCALEPHDDLVLVRAQVVDNQIDAGIIRILGEPYYDPSGMLNDGDEIGDCRFYYLTHMRVGDIGLFLLRTTPCDLHTVVEEEGGIYMCNLDPDFEGATAEEVVGAVLSDDCRSSRIPSFDHTTSNTRLKELYC